MKPIDSVFIYHMAEDPRYSRIAAQIIERIEERRSRYIHIGYITSMQLPKVEKETWRNTDF